MGGAGAEGTRQVLTLGDPGHVAPSLPLLQSGPRRLPFLHWCICLSLSRLQAAGEAHRPRICFGASKPGLALWPCQSPAESP